MAWFCKLSLRSRLAATLSLAMLPVWAGVIAVACWIPTAAVTPRAGIGVIALAVAASLLPAAWIIWAGVDRSLRPLRELTRAAESLSCGSRGGSCVQLPDDAPGEVGALARSLKQTIDQLRSSALAAAQEAAQRTEELSATFEGAAVGIMRVAPDGRLLEVNARLCEILHYSRDELLTLTWDQITHPDDLSREARCLAELTAGHATSYTLEKRCRTRGGDNVWVRLTSSLVRDWYRISFVEDVTEKKFAEEQWRDETVISEALNRIGQVVAAELDLRKLFQAIIDATTEVTGAAFGTFFYLAADDGSNASSVEAWAPGTKPARFSPQAVSCQQPGRFNDLPMPRITELFALTFDGADAVRLGDVTRDRRYGNNAPHKGVPAGHPPVRSYLAVPVVSRSGEVLGGLFVGHPEPDIFNDRDERLVAGIAAQASIAIDNARLFQAVRLAGERMAYQAQHDGLTGLPNRVLFTDRVERCLARARRYSDYHFAVLFMDLDRFKVVNDSLGHAAGDQLLVTVAQRLSRCLRKTDAISRIEPLPQVEMPAPPSRAGRGSADTAPDTRERDTREHGGGWAGPEPARVGPTVARMGGDEFTIILDDLREPTDAVRIAGKILAELAEPIRFEGQEITTSASIGIVCGAARYNDARDLLRDADAAMYRAKTGGRDRFAVFDASMHESAVNRLRMESDLRRALDRREMHLHYQPIVSLQTRELRAFEALMRWNREGKLISPAEFIPVAEDTGLIVSLGAWALEQACRQLRAWRDKHPSMQNVSINVNLSRKQFADPELVSRIKRILAETRLTPADLKLEITESVIMEDTAVGRDAITQINELGVGLQMDDFGTGYSSLSCLHKFPLQGLKIDRSFIVSISGRRDAVAVLQAIVTLAHNLGMEVVAEGLETGEQVALLQALECDRGQGFYFARPMPADAAEAFIIASPTPAALLPMAGTPISATPLALSA